MHSRTNTALTAALLPCALLATSCGGSATTVDNTATATAQPHINSDTCDTVRAEVIRVAANNGVNIVKIYEPKTIKSTPTKAVCSGRALVSSGQQAAVYYRTFQDADGDWLVEYSENRLD